MCRIPLALVALSLQLVGLDQATAAPFTPGNIAVYRTPDAFRLAVPVFIDEFSPTGQLVQSIAVPTVTIGPNRRLVADSGRTFEGLITRSPDRRFLAFAGYDSPVGTPNPASTAASDVNRVVARIDAFGNIDTTTALSDWGDSPRGAVTLDGTGFYVAGGDGGVRYTTLGSTTSTRLSNDINGVRGVNVFGSQLYASTGVENRSGVVAVGNGLPTTAGHTIYNLPGVAGGFAQRNVQFTFADLDAATEGHDTLYVAGHSAARLTKYSLVDGTWISNGTVGAGTTDQYHGVTASVEDSLVTLYATRLRDGSISELVRLTDSSGHGGAFAGTPTVIFTAAADANLLGVALTPIPEPAGMLLAVTAILTAAQCRGRHRPRAAKPRRDRGVFPSSATNQ